jgi:glycosyltransferase involved in cell wall biosynthesis
VTRTRLAIITATFPPDVCGVGDYTQQLGRALAATCDVTIVTARRKAPRPTDLPVIQAFRRDAPRDIFSAIPELERLRPDWVLVQYDPYSYGAWHSFNPYLPLMVRRLRRRLPSVRVASIVHETFVPPSNLRRLLMTSWQRAQLWTLGRASDLVVVVVEAWAKRLSTWFPNARVIHLPVGNNIPRVAVDPTTLRSELGLPNDRVILGWLGRTLEHRSEWLTQAIRATADAGAAPFVVHLGMGGHQAAGVLNGVPSKIAGVLSTHDLSRYLSALDIYLAPMAEGVSSRRTSVIAALAHGVPVVATAGVATDELFRTESGRALVLVDAERGPSFAETVARLAQSPGEREKLRHGAERLAASHFGWDSIAQTFLHHLEPAPVPAGNP